MGKEYIEQLEKYQNGVVNTGRSWDHVRNKPPDLNTGLSCLKNFLFITNVVFVLMGGSLLGFAAWLLNSKIADLAGKDIVLGTLVLAAFIIVVGILGCCGASQRSRCLLYLYALVLLALLVLQIMFGAFAFALKSNSEAILSASWKRSPENVRHETQERFRCCGFKSMPEDTTSCPEGATQPCLGVIKESLDHNIQALALLGVTAATIEFLAFTCAICLSRGLKSSNAKKNNTV